jgi:hypothetical protein
MSFFYDSLHGNSNAVLDGALARNSLNNGINDALGIKHNSAAGRLGGEFTANTTLNALGMGSTRPVFGGRPVIAPLITPASVTIYQTRALTHVSMDALESAIMGLVAQGIIDQFEASLAIRVMKNRSSHKYRADAGLVVDDLQSFIEYARFWLSNNGQNQTFCALQAYINDPVKDITLRAGDEDFASAMFMIARGMHTGVFSDVQASAYMRIAHNA